MTSPSAYHAAHPHRQNHPLLMRGQNGSSVQFLKPLFESVAAALLTNTRKLTATPLTFTLAAIEEEKPSDFLAARQDKSIAALFDVTGTGDAIAVLVEKPLVFALVEAVLGGDGLEQPFLTSRPLSKIERGMARLIAEHVGQAMQMAFSELLPLDLQFDRLEADFEFIDLWRSNSAALTATFDMEAVGRKACLSILLPTSHATRLSKSVVQTTPAGAEADPAWAHHLGSRVGEADLRLEAVFSETDFTLAEIASLKTGQVLRLKARQSTPLILQCDARPLFRCRMGQSDGRYAVRIDDAISAQGMIAESPEPPTP